MHTILIVSLFIFQFQISYSYNANSPSWICTDTDSTNDVPQTLPSCLPGYIIDIENVVYESTRDDTCSGLVLCQIERKTPLMFACNRKRSCTIDIKDLSFYINSTCSTTKRLVVKYKCLPVIHEQKDYLCEVSTARRTSLGDINLSCERNYRLHITTAIIGMSLKNQDEPTKSRFKCNKDTQTICNSIVSNFYRNICDSQLNEQNRGQCKIRYNERPMLKDCEYGSQSNYSLVEYSCIPDESIVEDLPRIDICSNNISERLIIDRGLIHSPNYPQSLGQYLSCKKQIVIPREAHLRLFMLEKTLQYSHELNINFLNNTFALARNDLIDINITSKYQDQIIEFNLKTNHVGDGNFLLYFQIDSYLSIYSPFDLEKPQEKTIFLKDWRILLGLIIGLIIIICLIIIFIVFAKRRQKRPIRYLKSDEDHRQRLNTPLPTPDRHHTKNLHIEQPYLTSSSPAILPSSFNANKRPNSATSTTSSIIMNQVHDNASDCESLIKPTNQHLNERKHDIDNLYEEIKEQQQQTALALGTNLNKGDINNPYLEAKSFEQNSRFIQGQKFVQPIRDHNETDRHYQHPKSSDNNQQEGNNLQASISRRNIELNNFEPSAPLQSLIEEHN